MTTKYPPYQFTVNSKKFPLVPTIMKLIDAGVVSPNRSKIICEALTEWYQKRRHLFETRYNNSNDEAGYREEMLLKFESLLPSIGEPLSTFRHDSNPGLYYHMTNELLAHSELVGHSLIDGVDNIRKKYKSGFGYHENQYITKALQYREYPTEQARVDAYTKSNEAWEDDENMKLLQYITNKAKEPQKIPKERREERIRELQQELRRLTEQQQQEEKREKQWQELQNKEAVAAAGMDKEKDQQQHQKVI